MLPKPHIFYGLIFSVLFWLVFPLTLWYNITLIFLASFLIDFDHYMCAVWKKSRWSLPKAYGYYINLRKKVVEEKGRGIFKKGDFHIFHTFEFHALVLAIGLIFNPFLYIFIGMLFHSLLDLADLTVKDEVYRREFFLTNWVRKKIEAKIVHKVIFPRK